MQNVFSDSKPPRHQWPLGHEDGIVTEPATWSIEIDRDICMGSGVCVVYAPNTFDQDAVSKAVVKDAHGDNLAAIRTAVAACPTGALRLIVGG
jgi:ferredoxin